MATIGSLVAGQVEGVWFGGNWTAVDLTQALSDVSWQEATQRVGEFHSIAELVYHIDYFVQAVLDVIDGKPLDAHDSVSFDVRAVASKEDWEQVCRTMFDNARQLAESVKSLPEDRWTQTFVEAKYGSWYRNLCGLVEHAHYHLGQIMMLKRLIRQSV